MKTSPRPQALLPAKFHGGSSSRNRLALILAGSAASLFALAPAAQAVVSTWQSGASTANWADAGNWGGTLPATSGSLTFGASTQTNLNNNLTSGTAWVVPALTFTSAAPAYTIGGNTFTLGNNAAGTAISNSSAQTQTINNNINLGNAMQTVSLANGGGVVLGGNITGSGTLSGLNVTGSGMLTLSGSNSYGAGYIGLSSSSANTIGSGATVRVTHAQGLGGSVATGMSWNSSTVAASIVSGGTLDLRSDTSTTFGPGNGMGYSIGSPSASGTATLNIGSLNGTATNQTITVGNIAISGSGSLLLTGNDGYSLNAGILRVSERGALINNVSGGVNLAGIIGNQGAGWAMWNFGGSGTTTVTGNAIRTLSGNTTNYTTQQLVKNDTGALILNGAVNDWGGNTTITGGTLSIGGVITDLYNTAALIVSNTSTVADGSDVALILRSSWTVGTLTTGTRGGDTPNAPNTANAANTATIKLDGENVTLAVKAMNWYSSSFSGNIVGTGGVTLLSRSRTNSSAEAATYLYGKNTYTGATTLNGGSLILDFSNAAVTTSSNIINNAENGSTLVLGGGALTVKGKNGDVNSQRFNGVEVTRGGSIVTMSQNSATSLLLSLGNITRNSAGGTVDFINPGTVTASNGITTTAANTNGILGGWATVGGNHWASVNGNGNIVALASYTDDAWADGNNTNVTTSNTLTSATTNSLRFNSAAANTLTLNGTNTVTSGGILVTSAVGANDTSITGGTLQGAGGQDLVVIQNNTDGTMTIGSVIADNGGATGLTKSGSGVLALTAANTYTGATNINGGVIQIGDASALGDASAATNSINFNGNGTLITTTALADLGLNRSTLQSTGGTYDLGVNRNIALNGAGTIQVDSGALTVSGVISGAATLTKTGAGTLILTGANTFDSQLAVTEGILNIQNGLALGSESLGSNITSYQNLPTTIADGATLQIQGNIHVGSETIMINGSGADGQNGALVNVSGYNTIGRNISVGTSIYLCGDSVISVDAGSLNILQSINTAFENTSVPNSATVPIWNLTLSGSGNGTLGNSATLTNIGGLIKNGTGTWTLLASSNFTGGVTLNSGVLSVSSLANGGSNSSIGKSTNAASNLVFAGDSTLRIQANSTTDRNFTIADGVTATLNLSGTVAAGASLTMTGGATGTNGLSTGGLTKIGTGNLTLTGTQGYTGATTVGAGTLTLDYSASTIVSNIINGDSVLALNGGALTIKGKASTTNSQAFNGLSVGSGASTINLNGNSATSLSVSLGGITRSSGGTLNFSMAPVSGTSVTTTSTNDSTGILGTWATTGTGTALGYAAVTSGSIGAYTGATAAANEAGLTDTTGAVNYNLSAGGGTVASTLSANTIRYTGGAGTSTVASSFKVNGLMNAGTGRWTIGGTTSSGTLIIGDSKELVINTNAQSIQINSVIADNADGASAVTLNSVNGNSGVVMLYGANTFSGPLNINAGTVYVNQVGGLGNGTEINLNGGILNPTVTMDFGSARTLNVGANGGSFQINPGTTVTVSGTVNLTTDGSFLTVSGANANSTANFSGIVAGDGGLWKSNACAMVLSNANTYRGETVVQSGILNIRHNNALGDLEGATTVLSTGTLQLQDNINVAEGLTLANNAVLQNVSGTNTYSGSINLAAAIYNNYGTSTITSDAGSKLILAGNVDLVYSNLTVAGAGDTAITGVVGNGSLGIQKNGTGTLSLTGANTYNGATTVSGGILDITSDAALGAAYDGSIGGYMTTVVGSGYATATTTISVAAPTTEGGITATPGAHAIQGGGSSFNYLSISGQDGAGYIYNPAVTISSPTGTGAAVTAMVKGLLTLDGGTLRTSGDITSNRAVVITSNGGTIDTNGYNSTFSGVFNNGASGSGSLTKTGAGSLNLSGTSIYAGATNVTGGTLIVSGSLTATSAVSTAADSILSVEGGGINGLAAITSAGTVQGNGSVGAVSVSAGGTLAPGKTTSATTVYGTLTANGDVSFTDETSIFSIRVGQTDNDKLTIAGGNSLELNKVTLALDLSAYTFTAEDVGHKFTIVSGGAAGTGGGNNIFNQGVFYTANNGNQFHIYYAAALSGDIVTTGNDIVLEFLAVPEPSTWGLIATGFGMLLGASRLRRNRC